MSSGYHFFHILYTDDLPDDEVSSSLVERRARSFAAWCVEQKPPLTARAQQARALADASISVLKGRCGGRLASAHAKRVALEGDSQEQTRALRTVYGHYYRRFCRPPAGGPAPLPGRVEPLVNGRVGTLLGCVESTIERDGAAERVVHSVYSSCGAQDGCAKGTLLCRHGFTRPEIVRWLDLESGCSFRNGGSPRAAAAASGGAAGAQMERCRAECVPGVGLSWPSRGKEVLEAYGRLGAKPGTDPRPPSAVEDYWDVVERCSSPESITTAIGEGVMGYPVAIVPKAPRSNAAGGKRRIGKCYHVPALSKRLCASWDEPGRLLATEPPPPYAHG